MTDAAEIQFSPRAILLQQELEVVKAALERSAQVESASRDKEEWSSKLRQWRDDIELSLRSLPSRTA
jgi:hypothetical protein